MSAKTTTWQKTLEAEKTQAKWLRQGTRVSVQLDVEPRSTSVPSGFGDKKPRKVYLVETSEYGTIYVSPIQMIAICDAAGNLTRGQVVINL